MADINVIVLPDGTEYPVSDYYLPVAISNPTAGQVLKYDAENQVWYNGDDAEGSSVFYGTSAPTSQLGVDGNLYVKYTEGTGGASDTVDALYVKLDGTWCQISTGGGGGTSDYNDLTNKPQINSVELSGNKSLDDLGIQPSEISKTATGSIVTFSDGGDNIPVESFECEIVAQQASGTPTPDNPLPITGFTQADIPVCGKNLVPIIVANIKANNTLGTWSGNTYTYNNVVYTIQTDENGNVTDISVNGTANATSFLYIANTFTLPKGSYVLNGCPSGGGIELARLQVNTGALNIDTGSSVNFTLTEVYKSCVCFIRVGNGFNPNGMVFKPMVRVSSDTDDTFAISKNTLYEIVFGQTIYGGRLIYANGKWFVRATHGIVDLGSLSWDSSTSGTSNIWRTSSPTNCKGYADSVVPTNILAEKYVADSVDNIYSSVAPNNAFAIRQSQNHIYVMRTDSNTPTGNLVYELATPIIIPLTSSVKIKTLSGVNNIFSNTGDSTVKYFTNDADGIEELINVSETSAENTTIDDTNLAYEANNAQEAFEKITKSLTWAEYQALSEEEKHNGTIYFIEDVNGDGQNFQPVIYSEEEREIGVWTDGRPVYEKTLNVGAIGSGTTFAHGITSLDWIIDYSLFGLYGGSNKYISPSNGSNSTIGFVISYWDSTNITFTKGNLSSNFSDCYCAIRYTKSSDTAGSGTWTPQGVPAHHYSTNEQVVGTWIDGKTLYEKTVYIPTLPNNSDVEYETGLSNIVQRGFDAHILFPSGNISKLPYINAANNNRVAIQFNANGKIQILTQYNNSGNSAYVTIRYTKSS